MMLRGAVGAAILLLALWAGCTVTPENYKLLSTFFDGVPDPAMSGPSGNTGGADPRKSPTYTLHRPFAEEKCEECHRGGGHPSRDDSSICLNCHAAIPTEHPIMHGPVAAGACMWCHAPHESPHAHLLRDVDRKVCAQCHTPAMLTNTKVPEHSDGTSSCLTCHYGHGGTVRFNLRSDDKSPAPAKPAKPEK
jgi:predicted CXXCH cytochrome family protein